MTVVTDASVVLAILLGEVGAEEMPAELRQALISSVNLSEVISSAEEKGGGADGRHLSDHRPP